MYEHRINTYILYYFNISHYDNISSSSSKSNNINTINNQLQRIMFLQTNNIHIVAEVLDTRLYCGCCVYVVPVVCCALLTAVEAGSTCSLNSFIQLHLFVLPFYLDFMFFGFIYLFIFFFLSFHIQLNAATIAPF